MATEEGNRIFHWLLFAAMAFLAGTIAWTEWQNESAEIDPDDPGQVGLGRGVYEVHCASCHGAQMEGQSGWRERLPTGRLPAPPHDQSGHTWHHPDEVLLGIVRDGMVPGKYAPPGYESDMPAFGEVLSEEEIRAVLAYIKSTWPPLERAYQAEIDGKSGSGR